LASFSFVSSQLFYSVSFTAFLSVFACYGLFAVGKHFNKGTELHNVQNIAQRSYATEHAKTHCFHTHILFG
jgi:hypothetical protein